MAFQQPPFRSSPLSQNGQMALAWTQWFQQVQDQLSYQGSPVIDGGTPSSVYGGSVTAINGGSVVTSGKPV
jgi:hypothetical protein